MLKNTNPLFTPVQKVPFGEGHIWVKRDDTYELAGIAGGKVRACNAIAMAGGRQGLITASARKSPQMQIVARLAARMGLPCRLHTATGPMTPEMDDAVAHGGTLVQHRPGYNSVIMARAEVDAKESGWTYIPFGMEHATALACTKEQAVGLAYEDDLAHSTYFKRIVICIGSGMSAAGVLTGLRELKWHVPMLGVVIGADPIKRLDRWAPPLWRSDLKLVVSSRAYTDAVVAYIDGVQLDPHYEAKCVEFLQPGDLFWIVGVRAGLDNKAAAD